MCLPPMDDGQVHEGKSEINESKRSRHTLNVIKPFIPFDRRSVCS